MEARDAAKGARTCEKCYAPLASGATMCGECGAQTNIGSKQEIDPSVYPEIARANLHRMRREFKEAEDCCLRVLKKLPNNAIAHTLLGDIAAERKDWPAAVSWYELALDLTPDSAEDKEKLQIAKRQLESAEAEITVEHLGLPAAQPRTYWLIAVIAMIALGIAIASYLALNRESPSELAGTPRSVNSPIILPDVQTPDPVTPLAGGGQPSPNPAVAKPMEDVKLAKEIKDRSKDGALLLEALSDPGARSATLTFIANEGDDERQVAARLAETALNAFSELQSVKLRAVRDKTLIFTATGTRSSLQSTRSDDWKELHGDDAVAWSDAFLTEEWSRDDKSPADGSPGTGGDTPSKEPPITGAGEGPNDPDATGPATPGNMPGEGDST